MTLLRLFHSETVTIVPQWHCYDCSIVTLLQSFHSDTITIVPWWHYYYCSTVTLLRLFHSDTTTIVPQWDCYDCSTVTLLRLFHSGNAAIVPQWHCYDCSTVRALRYKFYGLLTLYHSKIHCWRITICTRNMKHDPLVLYIFVKHVIFNKVATYRLESCNFVRKCSAK